MSRTKGINSAQRSPRDFYPTPQWCVNILAKFLYHAHYSSQIYVLNSLHVCDIGAGDGRIGVTSARAISVKKKQLVCIDVRNPTTKRLASNWLKKDFMQVDLAKLFTAGPAFKMYVSNPPYSMSNEIVKKTIKYMLNNDSTAIAAFLLRLNWLGSKKRSAFLQKYAPRKLIVLVPRPSFTGKGTDATEYAWLVWATPNVKVGKPVVISVKDAH